MAHVRGFPRTFWVANTIELFERLAYYGLNIVLSLYLTRRVGFDDGWALSISGVFLFALYLLPAPCGAIADGIGFRRALAVAFGCLASGYAALAVLPAQGTALVALGLIAVGGAFVKPTISGTVAKTSPEGRSKLGFSIFYMVVNIGGLAGKLIAKVLRQDVGPALASLGVADLGAYVERAMPPAALDAQIAARAAEQTPPVDPLAFLALLRWENFGLQVISAFSTLAALGALALVLFAYREPDRSGEPRRSLGQVALDTLRVVKDLRFMGFLLIVSGFEVMFWQLYLSMPLYIKRHLSETAPMEWIVAVNPAMIIALQMPVAYLVRRVRPLMAIACGIAISSAGMLTLALWPTLVGAVVSICIFALGEMTFAPRFLDYVAKLARPGQVGLYLGAGHLRAAVGSLAGGALSSVLMSRYCPEVGTREPATMWILYAGIGAICAALLLVYRRFTAAAAADG